MAFEAGVVIFFRKLAPDSTLARSVHPAGRAVVMDSRNAYDVHSEDYVVLNENDDILGIYPRDWVAAIMPLETIGPAANAVSEPPRRDSAPAAAEGDSQSVSGRIKRINPRQ